MDIHQSGRMIRVTAWTRGVYYWGQGPYQNKAIFIQKHTRFPFLSLGGQNCLIPAVTLGQFMKSFPDPKRSSSPMAFCDLPEKCKKASTFGRVADVTWTSPQPLAFSLPRLALQNSTVFERESGELWKQTSLEAEVLKLKSLFCHLLPVYSAAATENMQ